MKVSRIGIVNRRPFLLPTPVVPSAWISRSCHYYDYDYDYGCGYNHNNAVGSVLVYPDRVFYNDEFDFNPPSQPQPWSISPNPRDWCVFCRICDEKEPNIIMYQDKEYVVFNDHRPVAPNHFLVVTRHHIPNVFSLNKSDIPMIRRLWQIGQVELERRGGNLNDVRYGFHVPPRNSVNHLHLHVISPASTLSRGEKKRFGIDTWFFISVEKVLKHLEQLN